MRLARSDEFWALLLHCVLDRGSVADRHAVSLTRLAAADVLEGPLARALTVDQPLGRALVDCAMAGDWPRVLEMRARVRKALQGGIASVRLPIRAAPGGRLAKGLRLAHKMVDRSSVSVALVGPEGAAKDSLVKSLGAHFVFPTRRLRLGPGEPDRQLLVESRVHMLDSLRRRRRRLVIYDCPEAAALPAHWSASGGGGLLGLVRGRLRRRPDLVIMLARNVRHGRYSKQARQAAEFGRLEVVSTNRDPDVVRRDVTSRIWQVYVQRSLIGR
jgi:uncharacterized protein YggU (UPF0235/DUF167 family)